ncbi:GFA family protein [Sphingomonas sp. SUN039]|uniref:GFA family protein n=1 Tax=Sphingomonas sp. SUN039 TaxID=2937787 RepID=UPI0021644FBF|nr:GFA family protein [Sphingomonas sp. SUN039]UVO53809.1 GFA family protein [Sphingomonas sp. SUN039]
MSTSRSGGCQCGRIRYTAEIASPDAYLCHCRMCQRATGGVSIAFVNLPKAARTWEAEPDWYHSSPIARRPFCSACGTPLGFEFVDGENCDLTVGSFDDAAYFVPVSQFGIESRHDAWSNTLDLPGKRCDEHEALVERWAKVGMTVPE